MSEKPLSAKVVYMSLLFLVIACVAVVARLYDALWIIIIWHLSALVIWAYGHGLPDRD